MIACVGPARHSWFFSGKLERKVSPGSSTFKRRQRSSELRSGLYSATIRTLSKRTGFSAIECWTIRNMPVSTSASAASCPVQHLNPLVAVHHVRTSVLDHNVPSSAISFVGVSSVPLCFGRIPRLYAALRATREPSGPWLRTHSGCRVVNDSSSARVPVTPGHFALSSVELG